MSEDINNNLNNLDNSNGSNEKIIVGLDEAGRGPVLGPMVIASVKIDEKNLQKLNDLELKDSKQLSKKSVKNSI